MVFSHLESDAEKKRCEIAKNNVRLDKAEFASTYFYTFALNKKFCKGTDLKNNLKKLLVQKMEFFMQLIT